MGAPEGFDALLLAQLAGEALGETGGADEVGGGDILFVGRDDRRMARIAEALAFFAPSLERLEFPAWDCLPYDRVSPNGEIVCRRIDTLTRLLEKKDGARRRVILTTVSALLQRVPPRSAFAGASLNLAIGGRLDLGSLIDFLLSNGYCRSETVMETGEFAVRGGIVDVFPPGQGLPSRLDFFGDEVDAIRLFDPLSQRTSRKTESVTFKPVNEVLLNTGAVSRFRSGFRLLFGVAAEHDPLYMAVSAGRKQMGMEHWLPLFHERLEILFDYLPGGAVVILDHQVQEACDARLELINEYYAARATISPSGLAAADTVYNPLPPDRLYLGRELWDSLLVENPVGHLSPFAAPQGEDCIDAGGRQGRNFAEVRVRPGDNLFDALGQHIGEQIKAGRRVIVVALGEGSRDRLALVMNKHGVGEVGRVADLAAAERLPAATAALAVMGLERGFTSDALTVISEQDVLGERWRRPPRRQVRAEDLITDATSLFEGDLVVHADHGICRYDGLTAIEVAGAPHDCLRLLYDGGDKLFLPVENIELISRYGSEQASAALDRLGSAAWQARKAKMKQRLRNMAEELIKVAAARAVKAVGKAAPADGLFDEFCSRFPYTETEDQRRAIDDILTDLGSGAPADRLICGDVGFGKTEVALRAAFVMALEGRQVAVVVPTTLLCRQHYQTFSQRFADYPVRIEQLSRLVTGKRMKEAKAGLKDGAVDIVIGTHALLSGDVRFRDLALLVIDEEQHFGVADKEKLKRLRADVHVMTLTATPIPRTLQLALAGVKEMSLIATPPVDRLAVRTFVLPFDPVVIREAIMRERYRGGQTFCVCPRIEDIKRVERQLKVLVPEIKIVTVHGQMPAGKLEAAVTAFYAGACDLLLSTNIIESGLDLPSVNTIVIHRADMFGLSQLYQLRGRVGRSKVRAYAYLTLPTRHKLSAAAEKRLEVMQSLDSLGAGFSLASHDLDIRGAGNLLGGEQSGHIREVGIELYQHMLEEAVVEARGGDAGKEEDGDWSPRISIGIPVLIPDSFVADLNLRMELYRRLARVRENDEIKAFAAEMIDRFGALPEAVENLLKTVAIKGLCKAAGVDKVEAGPKGAVISFRGDDFANPEGLIVFITAQAATTKLRPDHKLVFRRAWEKAEIRLSGVQRLLRELAAIATE
ncbi:MAG TPA: transcription-repair coupling factor [Rhodospirillales bacterium]|nr:transcription-repair coupling factor [Rhodospirillales bacterium]